MQILLEKWAAEKLIHHKDIYQDLNTNIEIEMLAEVAAFFYDREQTLFLAEKLKERVRYFLENTMDLKLPPVSRIIEAIEVKQGLLVKRSADVYSFSHLTIQEYLTAFYYYVPGRMPQLIAARLFDAKWREVFLLQSGMSHSEGFLKEMLRVLKAHMEKHEVLKTAISWVNRLVRTGQTEKDTCVRVLLLGFLLRYRRDRGAEISSTMSTMSITRPIWASCWIKTFIKALIFQ